MARWSLEVLSAHGRDRERWHEHLATLPPHKKDVFFLPEYAALYEDVYNEPALFFRYGDERQTAVLVGAKRSIGTLPFYRSASDAGMGQLHDLTSPYGYGGPVVHSQEGIVDQEFFPAFREAIHDFCLGEGIVTEFLRLHPLMENHKLFGQDPGVYQKNYTVWIDLWLTESEIHDGMSKKHRNGVRRATSEGVEIVHSDLRLEHLREFHRLYTARMEARDAMGVFFFPLEFFERITVDLRDHVSLFLALWKGRTVSAYIVFHSGPYVHHFLSGSDSASWDIKANVLTVFRTALWAKSQGRQFYHLGGGHAVQMDSVFNFKSQFSSNRSPYYMYRHVHDPEAYDSLCRLKQEFEGGHSDNGTADGVSKDPLLADYFPAYRR
jgi:hypothetical protein